MTLFIINPTKTALIILLTVFFSIDAISQSWTFQEQHSDFDGIIYKAEVTINANTKLIVQSSDQNGKDLKVIINKKNFKHAPFDDETYLHILFSFDKKRIYQCRGMIDNQTGNIYIGQFVFNGWTSSYHNLSFFNDLKQSNRLVIKLDKLLGFGTTVNSRAFPPNNKEVFFTEVVKTNQRNQIPQELQVSLINSKSTIEKVFNISDYNYNKSRDKFSSDSLFVFELFQKALLSGDRVISDEEKLLNAHVKQILFWFDYSGFDLYNIINVIPNSTSYHGEVFKIYFRDDNYVEKLYNYVDDYKGIEYYFPFR